MKAGSNVINNIIRLYDKPKRGLFAFEWATLVYTFTTMAIAGVMCSHLINPLSIFLLRFRVVIIMLLLWMAYRFRPCPLTLLLRVMGQISLLGLWYNDIYEFNRILPNLDHIFASYEQSVFGMQPSLAFSRVISGKVVSELMCFGYVSYYFFIFIPALIIWKWRDNKTFLRAIFITIGAFFLYYIIFIFLPVAGPQYYFPAIGLETIERGVFPNIGNYFIYPREALAAGWDDGFFYHLLHIALHTGDCPVAAFPSSHVGVSTVIMLIIWRTKCYRMVVIMLPFYLVLCLSTVYIYAHYVIDTIAGLLSGVIFYAFLAHIYNKICPEFAD